MAWYGTAGWLYRKKITVDNAVVDTADQSSFPFLIYRATDTDLAADAQNDGDDILFTSADGTTKLSHEIEKFVSATGELWAWVKIPTLDFDADMDIYMYYGNAGATNQQDVANVWDSNFVAVYHLNGNANDSKGTNHGTLQNAPSSVPGKCSLAYSFNGTTQYISIPDAVALDITGNLTIVAWVKGTDTSGQIFCKGDNDAWASLVYTLQVKTSGANLAVSDGTTGNQQTGATTVSDDAWHMIAGVYVPSTRITVFHDGVADGENTTSIIAAIQSTADAVAIASDEAGAARFFAGIIDEIRISKSARAASWIKTEFNNQNNPAGFITVGAEELGGVAFIGSKTLLGVGI